MLNTRQFSLWTIPYIAALWDTCLYLSYTQSTESPCECSRQSGKACSQLQSSVFIYTAVLPLVQAEDSSSEIRGRNKSGGFLKTAVQYPASWALSRDAESRDVQSLPLCYAKGPGIKWTVLRAGDCGRGYYKLLTSCCEGWICSLLQGSYLEPCDRKGIEENAWTVLGLPVALLWENF